MDFFAADELVALGHGRSLAKKAAAFSGTHSPDAAHGPLLLVSLSRPIRRLSCGPGGGVLPFVM